MCSFRFRWFGDVSIRGRIRGYELAFATVPFFQDLCAGCTTQDSRVDEAREAHMGNVTRRAEDSFKIPDRFCSVNTLSEHIDIAELNVDHIRFRVYLI